MTNDPNLFADMTVADARKIIADHQQWRRGIVDRPQYSYRLVGRALDLLLDVTKPPEPST